MGWHLLVNWNGRNKRVMDHGFLGHVEGNAIEIVLRNGSHPFGRVNSLAGGRLRFVV